jgi:hypothetical protein
MKGSRCRDVPVAPRSPAVRLRDQMRVAPVAPVAPAIQRDIKGTKKWPQGEFKVDFTKNDAAAPGLAANEDGSITFTPSASAPESNDIHFIQVVRTFDTAAGGELSFAGTPEANRDKVRTASNPKKNIAPGFFVDEIFADPAMSPRTKKADPAVSPFYDAPPTPAGTVVGKKKGKVIVPAVLTDRPGTPATVKFNFVTAAKGRDTGIGYGTVLWGFETFHDKAGVTRIKNESVSFRIPEGETFSEAVRIFNEFMHNPGSSTAPKK